MSKKRKKILNVFIVDASGSMSSKAEEVKGELRRQFKDLRKDKDVSNRIMVVDFSSKDDLRVLSEPVKIKKLNKSIADNYSTRGYTALYDAVGKTFSQINSKKYDGVFVSILTDGLENDSREFTLSQVKTLIEEKRTKDKWGIVFSGTSEEAINQAVSMGIARGNTVTYMDTPEGLTRSASVRDGAKKLYKSAVTMSASKEEMEVDNLANKEEKET